jgi:hypothetical protein
MVVANRRHRAPPLTCLRLYREYHLYGLGAISQNNLGFTVPENVNVRRIMVVGKDNQPQCANTRNRYQDCSRAGWCDSRQVEKWKTLPKVLKDIARVIGLMLL